MLGVGLGLKANIFGRGLATRGLCLVSCGLVIITVSNIQNLECRSTLYIIQQKKDILIVLNLHVAI